MKLEKNNNYQIDKNFGELVAEFEDEINSLIDEKNILLEKVSEAQKFSRNKSEFLANMSHELRTPMHAILSFSKMSLKKLSVIEKNRLMNNLEIIYENGQRLLHTLNDILDISKLESDKMDFIFEEENLVTECEAIIRELQSLMLDKGLTYNIAIENTKGDGVFDAYRIGQVIQNILSNAIKFTPTEGAIEICISNTTYNEQDALKLSITDQGLGVPEDELSYIFDKYAQSSRQHSKIGGTGLGLSIAHKIVSHHGGKIWAENNKTSGSTFTFIIPTQQNQPQEA